VAQVLTARTVETIKAGPKRREIADKLLPGLYLVVQPTGAKSWAVRYRIAGRPRKHTLDAYPAIDLKAARDLASEALRAVAKGRDPGREKLESRVLVPDTVAAVVRQFVELHCRRHNRPRHARETTRLLERNMLPRWRARLMRDITRRNVLDLLDRLAEDGPITANRTLSAVRKLFNWAVSRDIIAASPCAGVKPPTPERSRDRVLSDDELCAVWQAADKLSGPFGALVKFLILTGQRRDEAAGVRWSELDLDSRLWTIGKERTKNGRTHDVPLSPQAVVIIESLPRIAGSDFVLTTTGKAPASDYSKKKRQLDALLPADMPAWRLHDIRRTVASGMARLGVNLPFIEKVLNHRSGSFGGIVGVYQRHDFAAEKRLALQAWGRHIEQIVSGQTAKVLPLQNRR
jgi:integrase